MKKGAKKFIYNFHTVPIRTHKLQEYDFPVYILGDISANYLETHKNYHKLSFCSCILKYIISLTFGLMTGNIKIKN